MIWKVITKEGKGRGVIRGNSVTGKGQSVSFVNEVEKEMKENEKVANEMNEVYRKG